MICPACTALKSPKTRICPVCGDDICEHSAARRKYRDDRGEVKQDFSCDDFGACVMRVARRFIRD